ncbi:enoyl-CoA hydratase-related protein [Pyruvatibacter sp.]|uniref:enoyl-CoA hydratase-related protein n=1 Tax=Pyruvatibacter sp. TaxID=1981328 RepID=UPI0032EEE048
MADDFVMMELTREGLATITLNNPDQHNAFNPDLVSDLVDRLEDLRANADTVRALVIRAEGPVFSGLTDFDWLPHIAHYTDDETEEDAEAIADVLSRVRDLPQPAIAVVNGPAAGYGLGLVAACDIVIATSRAQFVFSEIRHGFIPALAAPYVIEAMGMSAARRYMLTGEPFDAAEAHRLGLVDVLVDDMDDAAARLSRFVDLIFAAAPGAIASTKGLIDEVTGLPIDDELIDELVAAHGKNRTGADAAEGIAAFLEKREPNWRG